MSYASLSELKARVNILAADATRDQVLTALLSAAEKAIDGYCNRPDGFVAVSTAAARYYPGSGKPYQWIDECTQVTAVAVKDSSTDDEGDYTAWTLGTVGTTTSADVFPASGDPEHPDFTHTPYTFLLCGANGAYANFTSGKWSTRGGFRPTTEVYRGLPTVKVTARWGYAATVPAQVKEAVIAQSSRWYKRSESAWADAVASMDFSQLVYRQVIDPDIRMMLSESRLIRPAIGRR